MLRAYTMPATHDAALEQRERGFNCVGVSVALGVDAELVPNRLVPSLLAEFHRSTTVCAGVISKKYVEIFAQVLFDVLLERSTASIFCVEESKFAATLADSNDDFLVIEAGRLALVPELSADIGFVHFDFAVEHRSLRFDHRVPDAVAEVPRCFIADSERPLNLASAHALLGLAQQKRSHEPFRQREMAVIEDRARRNGELVIALFAVEELLFGLKLYHVHFAARAARTFGPAQTSQQLPAAIFGREHRVYVN